MFLATARHARFVGIELAFPLFPFNIHVRQSANGMATAAGGSCAAATEAGFGNEAYTHTVDEGGGYFLLCVHTVLVRCCREVE